MKRYLLIGVRSICAGCSYWFIDEVTETGDYMTTRYDHLSSEESAISCFEEIAEIARGKGDSVEQIVI